MFSTIALHHQKGDPNYLKPASGDYHITLNKMLKHPAARQNRGQCPRFCLTDLLSLLLEAQCLTLSLHVNGISFCKAPLKHRHSQRIL